MDFFIRTATKRDFTSVNALFNELHTHEHIEFGKVLNLRWPNSKSGQRFIKKHFDGEHNVVFVAVVDKEVVGYVFGGRVSTSRAWRSFNQFLLANIYVREEFRGIGVGAGLMDAFITWAKDNGANRIKLHAFTKNKNAIKLYKKYGFEESITTLALDV